MFRLDFEFEEEIPSLMEEIPYHIKYKPITDVEHRSAQLASILPTHRVSKSEKIKATKI